MVYNIFNSFSCELQVCCKICKNPKLLSSGKKIEIKRRLAESSVAKGGAAKGAIATKGSTVGLGAKAATAVSYVPGCCLATFWVSACVILQLIGCVFILAPQRFVYESFQPSKSYYDGFATTIDGSLILNGAGLAPQKIEAPLSGDLVVVDGGFGFEAQFDSKAIRIAEPLVGSGGTDGDKITLFGNEVDHDDVEKIILRATWLDTDDGNNVVAAMTYKLADDTEKVGWCFSDSASNLNDLLGSLSESSLGDEKVEEARYLAEAPSRKAEPQVVTARYHSMGPLHGYQDEQSSVDMFRTPRLVEAMMASGFLRQTEDYAQCKSTHTDRYQVNDIGQETLEWNDSFWTPNYETQYKICSNGDGEDNEYGNFDFVNIDYGWTKDVWHGGGRVGLPENGPEIYGPYGVTSYTHYLPASWLSNPKSQRQDRADEKILLRWLGARDHINAADRKALEEGDLFETSNGYKIFGASMHVVAGNSDWDGVPLFGDAGPLGKSMTFQIDALDAELIGKNGLTVKMVDDAGSKCLPSCDDTCWASCSPDCEGKDGDDAEKCKYACVTRCCVQNMVCARGCDEDSDEIIEDTADTSCARSKGLDEPRLGYANKRSEAAKAATAPPKDGWDHIDSIKYNEVDWKNEEARALKGSHQVFVKVEPSAGGPEYVGDVTGNEKLRTSSDQDVWDTQFDKSRLQLVYTATCTHFEWLAGNGLKALTGMWDSFGKNTRASSAPKKEETDPTASTTKRHPAKEFEEAGTWSTLEERCSSLLGADDFGRKLQTTSTTRRLDESHAVKDEVVLQMVNTLKKTHGTVELLRKDAASGSLLFQGSALRFCTWVAFSIFTFAFFALSLVKYFQNYDYHEKLRVALVDGNQEASGEVSV
jgi:hypothetical protein